MSYILGAPDFVTQPFRDLFAYGLPLMTPLLPGARDSPAGAEAGSRGAVGLVGSRLRRAAPRTHGLTEGVEYDLQVRASNSDGTGPSSEVFSESTVATAPGACHHRLLAAKIRASAIPNIQLYLVDLIADYTCDASTLRVWQAT